MTSASKNWNSKKSSSKEEEEWETWPDQEWEVVDKKDKSTDSAKKAKKMGKNEKPETDPDEAHDDSAWKKRKDLGEGEFDFLEDDKLKKYREKTTKNWKVTEHLDDECYKVLKVKENDLIFLWGKDGEVVEAVAKAAECSIDLDEDKNYVEIWSEKEDEVAVQRGIRYINYMRQKRVNKQEMLNFSFEDDNDNEESDVTVVRVPKDHGPKSSDLARTEVQYGCIMSYSALKVGDVKSSTKLEHFFGPELFTEDWENAHEKLEFVSIVAKNEVVRMAAAYKVMASVEAKWPGFYTNNVKKEEVTSTSPGLAVSTIRLTKDEVGFVMGAKAATMKKLVAAACDPVDESAEYINADSD
jgi:hypothetical protein